MQTSHHDLNSDYIYMKSLKQKQWLVCVRECGWGVCVKLLMMGERNRGEGGGAVRKSGVYGFICLTTFKQVPWLQAGAEH